MANNSRISDIKAHHRIRGDDDDFKSDLYTISALLASITILWWPTAGWRELAVLQAHKQFVQHTVTKPENLFWTHSKSVFVHVINLVTGLVVRNRSSHTDGYTIMPAAGSQMESRNYIFALRIFYSHKERI